MNLISMRWDDLLFAHWDIEPATVDGALPEGVEVDTYDGRAYLGVVAFVMRDIRPRPLPPRLGLNFAELNLRTYVRVGGERGIYFFSLDADDRLGVAVARRLYSLPYYRATTRFDRDDGEVRFRSSRTHRDAPPANFDATYRPTGDGFYADEGSLEEFLTENYAFFVASDTVYRGDVEHTPWRLHEAEAEIRTNTLFEANGFNAPDGDPHILYSKGVDVRAAPLRRMTSV